MFDRFSFLIGEALVALRRNFAMTLAAVTTGAVALFLLAGLLCTYGLAKTFATSVPGMFDMRVFLRDGVTFQQVSSTAQEIRALRGVASVVWIPRANMWALMQKQHPDLTAGIQDPLPEQLKVVLSDIHSGEAVASQIQALPTVATDQGVRYLRREQKFAMAALDAFSALGPAVVALLLGATAILIFNTIRLTLEARRLEIRIMQLVGASRFTVRFPFVVEGVIQGLTAGAFAGALLLFANKMLRDRLGLEGIQLVALPALQAWWGLIGLGSAYGFVCSIVAVRVPIRYR